MSDNQIVDPELRDAAIHFEDTQFGHIAKMSVTCGDGTVRDLWVTRRQALSFAEKIQQHYAERPQIEASNER